MPLVPSGRLKACADPFGDDRYQAHFQKRAPSEGRCEQKLAGAIDCGRYGVSSRDANHKGDLSWEGPMLPRRYAEFSREVPSRSSLAMQKYGTPCPDPAYRAFMANDVKFAVRKLLKSPGFALTAIITLALGIGANAVVFSVLNALVLRPINVPNSQNLYMVQRMQWPSHSYPDYLDLRDRNRTFESLFLYDILGPVGVDTGGNPSTAWPFMASGNYFDSLGIQPFLGRFYHGSDENGYNSAPYVVLSYTFWHSHFHDDRNIVGRNLQINKHPMTVIGVAPKSFRGTELFFAPAMWIPIVEMPLVQGANNLQYRGNHSSMLVGRLKPGVTPQQATADLNTLAAALSKAYPSDDDGLKFSLAHPGLMGDMLGGPA